MLTDSPINETCGTVSGGRITINLPGTVVGFTPLTIPDTSISPGNAKVLAGSLFLLKNNANAPIGTIGYAKNTAQNAGIAAAFAYNNENVPVSVIGTGADIQNAPSGWSILTHEWDSVTEHFSNNVQLSGGERWLYIPFGR
jgi:hypothetical protein